MMNLDLNYCKRHGILRAQWVIGSETGEEYLVDIDENRIIAKRVDGKIVDPGEGNETRKEA